MAEHVVVFLKQGNRNSMHIRRVTVTRRYSPCRYREIYADVPAELTFIYKREGRHPSVNPLIPVQEHRKQPSPQGAAFFMREVMECLAIGVTHGSNNTLVGAGAVEALHDDPEKLEWNYT
jgi:hypothetical protein